MRKCPKCGTELPDEALFCNECGERLPSPAAEEKAEKKAEENEDDKKEAASGDTTASEASTETVNKAPESSAAPETPAAETTTETAAATSGASASYTAPSDNSVLTKAQTESKNSNVGRIAVAAVGALVVLLIIILVCNSGGYKSPIKDLVRNFNNRNTDVTDYLSCVAPAFATDLYKDVYGIIRSADKDAVADFDDEVVKELEDYYDDIADTFGDDFKLTFEFRDAERLDDRDIKDIEDLYEDLFDLIDDNIDYEDEDIYEELAESLDDDFDISLKDSQIRKLQNAVESFMGHLENFKIQDAYEVKLRLELKGEDDSEKETITIIVIKAGGDWFIEPNSLLEAMGEGSLSSALYGLMWYY